jgi:hypothetical protein
MYHPSNTPYNTIAEGIVHDTNDPQRRGRIKVFCPVFVTESTKLITLYLGLRGDEFIVL